MGPHTYIQCCCFSEQIPMHGSPRYGTRITYNAFGVIFQFQRMRRRTNSNLDEASQFKFICGASFCYSVEVQVIHRKEAGLLPKHLNQDNRKDTEKLDIQSIHFPHRSSSSSWLGKILSNSWFWELFRIHPLKSILNTCVCVHMSGCHCMGGK